MNNRLERVDATLGDVRALTRILLQFREPSHGRSALEFLIKIVPFAGLWFLMWLALHIQYGLVSLLAVPAAGFLVRLFMIQHDCGHGSFFRNRLLNDWLGRVIGVLTLTPYDFWRRSMPPTMRLQAISTSGAWGTSAR